MPVATDAIQRELASRTKSVRAGLCAGFAGEPVAETFKGLFGGVWMSADDVCDIPFEDSQFDVVILNGDYMTHAAAREANRVLIPDGYLLFTVRERNGKQQGFTPAEVYKMVREGFDILSLNLPKWWKFGIGGRTITACARKKAWREHKGFIREGTLPFTPFRSRT